MPHYYFCFKLEKPLFKKIVHRSCYRQDVTFLFDGKLFFKSFFTSTNFISSFSCCGHDEYCRVVVSSSIITLISNTRHQNFLIIFMIQKPTSDYRLLSNTKCGKFLLSYFLTWFVDFYTRLLLIGINKHQKIKYPFVYILWWSWSVGWSPFFYKKILLISLLGLVLVGGILIKVLCFSHLIAISLEKKILWKKVFFKRCVFFLCGFLCLLSCVQKIIW